MLASKPFPYPKGCHALGASWLPTDLSGLVLWLKADSITGLNDGDAVGTIPDDSGNGYDLSVLGGSAGRKAIYKANIQNGLPVVRFDGVDDGYGNTDIPSQSQPYCVFFVANITDDGADSATWWNSLSNQGRMLFYQPNSNYYLFCGAWGCKSGATTAAQPWGIYRFEVNGASSKVYKDGILWFSGDAGSISITDFYLGNESSGGDACGMDWGEHIIYDNIPSSGDITLIEDYLSRWT